MSNVKLESVVESRVVRWATEAGIIALKFTPEGSRGWPDHIFMKNGRVAFIEFKAVGDEPRKLQKFRMLELQNESIPVMWTADYDAAIRFLELVLYG